MQQQGETLNIQPQQYIQQQNQSYQNQITPNTIPTSNTISQFIIKTLLQSFNSQLKVRSLMKHIAQFNTSNLHYFNKQCVAYFYLQGQSKCVDMINKTVQDKMPTNICKDGLAVNNNNSNKSKWQDIKTVRKLQFENNNNDSLILPIKIIGTNNSLNYSASKSRYDDQKQQQVKLNSNDIKKASSFQVTRVNQFKQSQQLLSVVNSNIDNYPSPQQEQQSSTTPSHPIPLNLQPQQRQKPNLQLQTQLQHIKKNLYQLRRYRRIGIQQQRANIDLINRKKSHLLFSKMMSNHTYDYDGGVITNNNNSNKKYINNESKDVNNNGSTFNGILEIKTSSSLLKSNTQRNKLSLSKRHNNNNKNNNNNNKLLNLSTGQVATTSLFNNDPILSFQDTNPQRNLTSQQKNQKVSYNNGNKRQVSHLPFISLKDNAKMTQNTKQLSGSVTQRNSLYRSKISMSSTDNNSNGKFRSFSQIQLQKRLQRSKQKALDFTQQQQTDMLGGIDILPPTLNLTHQNNSQPHNRKQSKMMQKYLKKLTQQKTKIQKMIQKDSSRLKSVNFQQVVLPQKYPIQRYYEYDFDSQKRAHQYSIVSKLSTKRNSLSVANQTQTNY